MDETILRNGLIKILRDYPSIREYSNIKNKKENGKFDENKEEERKEYSSFINMFNEKLSNNLPNNYKVKISNLAQGADRVPYITIIEGEDNTSPRDNFYVVYLFKPNGEGVYLSLGLGVSQFVDSQNFNKNSLEMIKSIKDNFKSHLILKSNDYDIDLNSNNLKDEVELEDHGNLSKAYDVGGLFAKYYSFDKDDEYSFASEKELWSDLKEYLKVYDFAINFEDDFNKLKGAFDSDLSSKKISDISDELINIGLDNNEKVSKEDFDNNLYILIDELNNNGTHINANDYDGFFVKQITKSDTFENNNKSGQIDIRLSNVQKNMFPFLVHEGYLLNSNPNEVYKSYTFLKLPVYLRKSNLDLLSRSNLDNLQMEDDSKQSIIDCLEKLNSDDDIVESYTSVLRGIPNKKEDVFSTRVEISPLRNFDGEYFDVLRKLLCPNDFLVFMRRKLTFEFDVFCIPYTDDFDKKFKDNFNNKLFVYKYNSKDYPKNNYLLLDEFYNSEFELRESTRLSGAENILIYGVPGSGKSWTIQNEYCDDESRIERVVFHPDYTYSDFIGQILPHVSEGKVDYKFTEGPFTLILKKAWENPNKKFYLIIEEINRGNAPAIFGDVFQLLDRKKESDNVYNVGTSEYGITNSDIADKIYEKFSDLDSNSKVRIPSNLFIIATMNTADQNVFTLDTAFQRRWNMRLIPNKFKDDHDFADETILESKITWKQFVMSINDLILDKNSLTTSSEDKRLGVYFIQENDLKDSNKFAEKVLKYLWDDAFKFSREDIFKEDYRSLEDIIDEFTTNKDNPFNVFKEEIYDLISKSK